MDFVVRGLDVKPYQYLFGKTKSELSEFGVYRYACDQEFAFPDRIEMRDAHIGETLLLVNHVSMDKPTPYRATHAIFVLEGAEETYQGYNEIPDVMQRRKLSLRAFSETGFIIAADLVDGVNAREAIHRFLEDHNVQHIDAHYALRGCYAGRITRG